MKVTQEQLIEIIADSDAKEISVNSESDVTKKMNKTGNPFFEKEGRKMVPLHTVTKQTIAPYGFGGNYGDRVSKALTMSGSDANYEVSQKTWAETVVPGKVIRHKEKGTYYLIVYNEPTKMGDVVDAETSYFVDGKPATEQEVKTITEFTPHSDSYKKQRDAGVDEGYEVITMTISFDNIKSVVLGNTLYELQ